MLGRRACAAPAPPALRGGGRRARRRPADGTDARDVAYTAHHVHLGLTTGAGGAVLAKLVVASVASGWRGCPRRTRRRCAAPSGRGIRRTPRLSFPHVLLLLLFLLLLLLLLVVVISVSTVSLRAALCMDGRRCPGAAAVSRAARRCGAVGEQDLLAQMLLTLGDGGELRLELGDAPEVLQPRQLEQPPTLRALDGHLPRELIYCIVPRLEHRAVVAVLELDELLLQPGAEQDGVGARSRTPRRKRQARCAHGMPLLHLLVLAVAAKDGRLLLLGHRNASHHATDRAHGAERTAASDDGAQRSGWHAREPAAAQRLAQHCHVPRARRRRHRGGRPAALFPVDADFGGWRLWHDAASITKQVSKFVQSIRATSMVRVHAVLKVTHLGRRQQQ